MFVYILILFLFTYMTRKWTLFIGNLHVLYNRGLHGHKATQRNVELRIILFAEISGAKTTTTYYRSKIKLQNIYTVKFFPYFFLLYVVMLYVTDNKLQLNFQLVTHEREHNGSLNNVIFLSSPLFFGEGAIYR